MGVERKSRTESLAPSFIYKPRAGYRLAAFAYDKWHWLEFWRRNEVPVAQRWAATLEPGLFLDGGSGTGLYRSILESDGHRVLSADLSFEMLAIQRRVYSDACLVQANLQALPFRSGLFDYVLCTRVLSHIQMIASVLSEFRRVARAGAQLLISDVHPEHRYSEMTIPTGEKEIAIQVFKHSIPELKMAFASASLQVLDFQEHRFKDLIWKPPIEKFRKIYDEPDRGIFYTCILKRP
jgi:ubiquinone/menaquinone biosynthesis C-methylase UbiE